MNVHFLLLNKQILIAIFIIYFVQHYVQIIYNIKQKVKFNIG